MPFFKIAAAALVFVGTSLAASAQSLVLPDRSGQLWVQDPANEDVWYPVGRENAGNIGDDTVGGDTFMGPASPDAQPFTLEEYRRFERATGEAIAR